MGAMPVLITDPKDAASLARLWEGNFHIRERLRPVLDAEGKMVPGKLIAWPNPKNKSISMEAIAMNIHLLKELARWWCPTVTSRPKSPNIHVIKPQAMLPQTGAIPESFGCQPIFHMKQY